LYLNIIVYMLANLLTI